VFVSVVDPGVGTNRKSVVMKTRTGHFIVTPDNGTLTHVAASLGIESVRMINEQLNRRTDTEQSYTFHGRDVYAFTAARLASGIIQYEQVGDLLRSPVVSISFQKPSIENGRITGGIPVLDVQYGNVWTNIPSQLFSQLKIKEGDLLEVIIQKGDIKLYQSVLPYHTTFGKVASGKPLVYLNSLLQLSFAINEGSFAGQYGIASGPAYTVRVRKVTSPQ
jgi:S-adenosylmethionine hydrolase